MPSVEEYKIGILRQLVELEALGRDAVLPLRATPSEAAIRAVAELETDGLVVFEHDSLSCRLTTYGSRIADALVRELEIKQKRK